MRRDNLADLLFIAHGTTYGDQQLPGLALNIVRYNAGGSSLAPIGDSVMQVHGELFWSWFGANTVQPFEGENVDS
jgi:hypothetical protein